MAFDSACQRATYVLASLEEGHSHGGCWGELQCGSARVAVRVGIDLQGLAPPAGGLRCANTLVFSHLLRSLESSHVELPITWTVEPGYVGSNVHGERMRR